MLDNSKGGTTFTENKENSMPDNHWNDVGLSKKKILFFFK